MKKLNLIVAIISTSLLISCGNTNKKENIVVVDEEQTEEIAQTDVAVAEPVTEEVDDTETTGEDDSDIIAVASGNEDFSTLVAAVEAATLVETLKSEGPFTVFAPTNDAFAELPEGTVETLLAPENKEMLSSILTYHVVSGKLMAADVVKAINDNNGSYKVTTVQGNELTATLDGETVMLIDAKGNKSVIVATDVDASNGVIHAIDTVIMPE
ncbi:fasciclin domain-containing protein [Aquimarina sp. ERC-38]|uniref:fasciclin domain-containing protein n=1 Tax=Aquimarina sp. ERC-38 TaxID=2949996 RepID=UPI002245A5D3|nr:fasciclin domain-containing protein [Aquimarina sp. ERC-38]UZO82054.1 fasciclin domain-containing protein [Aquimarina sp. ERC-38]